MAVLPPPPVQDQQGSFAWLEWYRQLRNYISTSGSVPWYLINFSGSTITDIADRSHQNLQALQGGTTGERYHLTAAQHAALSAGDHNDLTGIQGGNSLERYHMSVANYDAVSQMSWDTDYGVPTVDLGYGGVSQQVGLEVYRFCHNTTGVTIPNGTVVVFVGAHGDGHALIAPVAASTTLQPNQVVGITTQDIANNDHGYVTWYGLVHELDTTGSSVGETWAVGDVLYLHPTIPGALTNVKPTAPYVVLPMAGVFIVNATTGVIGVKPTPAPRLYYGTFRDTTTKTIAVINTAYPITFNTTSDASGIALGTPTSRIVVSNSGRYQIEFSAQLVSASASTKNVWIWYRKNGIDVPNSTRQITTSGASTYTIASWNYTDTLLVNDYIELCWASDSTAVSMVPTAASAFYPAGSSIKVTLSQINQ